MVCGILFLGLFLFKRDFKPALYFSLFCFAFSYRFLAGNDGIYFLIYLVPDLAWELTTRLEYITLYWGNTWAILFVYYNFYERRRRGWFLNLLLVIVWVYTVITLFSPAVFYTKTLIYFNLIQFVYIGYVFYVFVHALIISKNKLTQIISIISLSSMALTGSYTLLTYLNIVESIPFLLSIGFLIFVVTQAFILSSRFAFAFNQVELLKDNIEGYFENIQSISLIGQQLTQDLDFTHMLSFAYERINQMMDASEFGVGIYDESTHRLHHDFYIFNGELITDSLTTNIDESERFSSYVIRNKQSILLNDIRTEYNKYISSLGDLDTDELLNSLICIPLIVENKVLGIMSVQGKNKYAYTNYHLDILQTMANYIAIAIDNSNAYSSLKQANNSLKDKNNNILDSIRYAKTIQTAFLPDQQVFQNAFAEVGIMYQPKDLVSGDFYWYAEKGNKKFFAVADCTGHGVPGAFMSIIGISLLNEITQSLQQEDTHQILETLDKLLRINLDQASKQNTDGMDIALCMVEEQTGTSTTKVSFSGAKRSLYYKKNGGLVKLKGTNRSIGGIHKTHKPFTSNQLSLEKGDCIYLFTDGLADQNNIYNQKLGSLQVEKMLQEVTYESIDAQITSFMELFNVFKGEADQRDDILLVGIKL